MLALEEKTIQRPFGLKLCHEFISLVLHSMRRATPPASGTIHSSLSGRSSWPFAALTNTTKRPSGVTFGKELLAPLPDAPAMGSGRPPRPPEKGMR